MRYISLFSGVGGLESANHRPVLCCELDDACIPVLERRFAGVRVHPDVTTLRPPKADVVTGGWPCQDISVAGLRRGLAGERSGLFFEMLRVAGEAGAHTIIAENVPNLLVMERGRTFEGILRAFEIDGFPYVSWRMINAREFGLPHQRLRIFVVASRHPEIARALHRPYDHDPPAGTEAAKPRCAGFYWTAGLQSLCYNVGFVPTLKVGSSLSIPSPPAVHFDDCVRKATPEECLRLQGFDPSDFVGSKTKDIYRMSGNAVAVPVGRFVMNSIEADPVPDLAIGSFGRVGPSGLYDDGLIKNVEHSALPLATNLCEFIDLNDRTSLSPRASAGLIARLRRSGKPCPGEVLEILLRLAGGARTVGVAGEGASADVEGSLDKRVTTDRGGTTGSGRAASYGSDGHANRERMQLDLLETGAREEGVV